MSEQPEDVLPATAFRGFFNALLESRGLSGAQAARKLGVAQSQVSRWKRGEGGISLENLQRIHETFGIDLAYLTGLAGIRDSSASTVNDSIEAERQLWRARYDDLIEKKVPRWAREAYIAACEALAEAYNQMRPGQLNSANDTSLNAPANENDTGEDEHDEGRLVRGYRPVRSTYRSATLSVAPAR